MGTKEKRKASHELCRGGGEESESVDMGTTRTPYVSSGSGSGSVSATHSQQIGSFLPPRSMRPLDRYVTSEARQATLNTPFKKRKEDKHPEHLCDGSTLVLEHKRLNALAYVKYSLALQQRSKKMREKYDPIITEIKDPVLPEDPTWLEDELLYNVEAVKNVSPLVYEGGPYIQEPREFSHPPPREPTPPCEPTQPRGLITYKRKRGNEESSSQRNVKYYSEESFDELMTYPTRSSRVGNEEDDAFYLDEEDLDD
ncbi:hypothetical protein DVH24_020564 [Malus domestica]|uniref:Uncharacterized protein n=1 Tax=Malus domestica TaxID=3750 RepID=A0A498JDV6_MALDO|nr:hypothetical protein DVH24_020564 [Malus domestica]